jgi:hypothetical protein
MRYLIAVLFLAVLANAQQAGSTSANSPQSIPVDQENANRAKALIEQMIQALGGEAYLSIQDMTQEGRTYAFHHGQPEGAGVLFWRFYKYPDRDRIELTKQRDVVYIYRGDQGFETTYKGTRADDPKTVSDYVRRRQYALDWVLREWLHEPGIALFFEGSAVAAQKDTLQVSIINSRNQAVTLNIDANTHLPVKKSFSWRDPTDKQRNFEDEVFDAYRPVSGIMTPFSITRFYNGDMSNQRFVTGVAYNKGLSDTLFATTINYSPPTGR